jgi:hypothetical protein
MMVVLNRGIYILFFTALLVYAGGVAARGGPGGVMYAADVWIFQVAIVSSVIAGLISGFLFKRKFALALICGVVAMAILTFLLDRNFLLVLLFGGPAIVVGMILFVIAADFISHVRFHKDSIDRNLFKGTSEVQRNRSNNILQWIGGTYFFWVIISLLNFNLLGNLVYTPLVFIFSGAIAKFMPFILLPLILSLLVGLFAMVVYVIKRYKIFSGYMLSLVFNLTVLVSFIAFAELSRIYLMSESLAGHKTEELKKSYFIESVIDCRPGYHLSHASFTEDKHIYIWSYSERKFIYVR